MVLNAAAAPVNSLVVSSRYGSKRFLPCPNMLWRMGEWLQFVLCWRCLLFLYMFHNLVRDCLEHAVSLPILQRLHLSCLSVSPARDFPRYCLFIPLFGAGASFVAYRVQCPNDGSISVCSPRVFSRHSQSWWSPPYQRSLEVSTQWSRPLQLIHCVRRVWDYTH